MSGKPSGEMVCRPEDDGSVNNNLCIPADYNKFDLPLANTVNFIDVGIDITDVLRINDKVSSFQTIFFDRTHFRNMLLTLVPISM